MPNFFTYNNETPIFWEEYQRLGETEQRLTQIYCLAYTPISEGELLGIFNGCAKVWKLPNISVLGSKTETLLKNVGIYPFKKTTKKQIDPHFGNFLLFQLGKKDSQIDFLTQTINQRMTAYGWEYEKILEVKERNLRIAYATGNINAFIFHLNDLLNNPKKKFTRREIFDYFLPIHDKNVREKIPISLLAYALSELVQSSLFLADNVIDIQEFAISQLPRFVEEDRTTLTYQLLTQLLLEKGHQHPRINDLKPYFNPTHQYLLKGFEALNHDFAAAKNYFDALTKEQNKTVSKTVLMVGWVPFLHILLEIYTNDAIAWKKIGVYINKLVKSNTEYNFWSVNIFTALLALRQGNTKEAKANINQVHRSNLSNSQRFFYFFAQYWIDEKLIDKEALRGYGDVLRKGRYDWAAVQIQKLISILIPSDTIKEYETNEELKKLGINTPIYQLIEKVEEWDNTLNALMNLGGISKPSAKEGASRVVWLIDFRNEQIQPKEQTLLKKGWSVGRNIALRRLKEENIPFMTPQDRKICTTIENAYNGWNYNYEWNYDKAIKELVGHPYIFLMNSPEVGVQLEADDVHLIAKESDHFFTLSISHDVSNEGGQVIKETPTRYKYINVTPELVRLKEMIGGNTFTVPKNGKEKFLAVIENLSKFVEVKSILTESVEHLPLVAPSNKMSVHLLPFGDGFQVETFVKPLGSVPPYFKVAEGEDILIGEVNGQKVRTQRDFKAEKAAQKNLIDKSPLLQEIKPKGKIWHIEEVEQCLQLLTELNPLVDIGEITIEWPRGERFKLKRVLGIGNFNMRVTQQTDWLAVSGEIRVDENKVLTMQELLELSRKAKGQFIEVSSGQFLALTTEFQKRLKRINALFNIAKDGTLQMHPLASGALLDFAEGAEKIDLDKKFKESQKKLENAFKTKYLLPADFKAELRPYQMEGYEWLMRRADWGVGVCLADDMGLGKTVQGLAMIQARSQYGATLVVAPASVCHNWAKEVERFTPALIPILFADHADRKATIEQVGKGDILIVTYDLMTRENELFTSKEFATIILDEAQAIKNKGTKRSETAMQLKGEYRVAMSGTPIENHLGELWNLFQFLNPNLLGSMDYFTSEFAVPIERDRDKARQEQLQGLLKPFILRRKKDDVLKDLPPKTEIVLTVELSDEERTFYEALRRSAIQSLAMIEQMPDQEGGNHIRILAEIMKLRRAACNPRLIEPNISIESAKLKLFGEVVEELLDNGHRALVFSQFVGHLGLLRQYLDGKGITYKYLDGQTPQKQRQQSITEFQAGEGDLFLISLKAGGTGLNLTAADYVIHMDPWWNPAVEDQASDRAHRIGQKKPVTVYRLVSENTIEDKILKLHEHKRHLAESLLEGSDSGAKLNAKELMELINNR